MTDTYDTPAESDKAPASPEQQVESDAISKIVDEIMQSFGHLGIGSGQFILPEAATVPFRASTLPLVEIVDPSLPMPAAAATDSPTAGKSLIELPPAPIHIEAEDGSTINAYPTGNPLKKEAGIEVSGTF